MSTKRNLSPGVLWLLPLFFGIFGGIVAALISSLKYQSGWFALFAGGCIVSVIWFLLYFVLVIFAITAI